MGPGPNLQDQDRTSRTPLPLISWCLLGRAGLVRLSGDASGRISSSGLQTLLLDLSQVSTAHSTFPSMPFPSCGLTPHCPGSCGGSGRRSVWRRGRRRQLLFQPGETTARAQLQPVTGPHLLTIRRCPPRLRAKNTCCHGCRAILSCCYGYLPYTDCQSVSTSVTRFAATPARPRPSLG